MLTGSLCLTVPDIFLNNLKAVLPYGRDKVAGRPEGMVIMAMAYHYCIYRLQVYPQFSGILPGEPGLSCIRKDPVVFRFHIKALPMLCLESFPRRGIFH